MESSASAGRVASVVLDPRRWWALALLVRRVFHGAPGRNDHDRGAALDRGRLRFSEQGLQWVLSAYALTFGGLLLLGGRAADLLGRRRVFMAGAVFFTAASLLCGLAWSPAALLAARVVQGAGAAIMTPTALSIISATFTEGSERNKALGISGALGGIGATTAWVRAMLATIRSSHVLRVDRPSNRSRPRSAPGQASCTTSSATALERTNVSATLCIAAP